jgi:hypothetical protein
MDNKESRQELMEPMRIYYNYIKSLMERHKAEARITMTAQKRREQQRGKGYSPIFYGALAHDIFSPFPLMLPIMRILCLFAPQLFDPSFDLDIVIIFTRTYLKGFGKYF